MAQSVLADRLLPEEENEPRDEKSTLAFLQIAILHRWRGRIAATSSFGAESALLLSLVAEVDRAIPVLFLDTGKHFPETYAYRDLLTARLGLTDVRNVSPDPAALARRDPEEDLHRYIPDDCCEIRKVEPLTAALVPFAAWITGRKRFQSATRASLEPEEQDGERVKLNPLALWSVSAIAAATRRRNLPAHPLAPRG